MGISGERSHSDQEENTSTLKSRIKTFMEKMDIVIMYSQNGRAREISPRWIYSVDMTLHKLKEVKRRLEERWESGRYYSSRSRMYVFRDVPFYK